jgi:hypothetical protein
VRLLRGIQKGAAIVIWRLRHYGLRVTWTWLWTRIFMWTVGRDVWRYCQITPQLFVGGQMHGSGWSWLVAHGVTANVNLRENHDDCVHGVPRDVHLWLPTRDDHAPTLEQLHAGVEFIRRIIDQGGRVYVHCASGVGRAPTMAAAYLISTGLTPQQAIVTIRRVRPFIKPTLPQIEALERYAMQFRAGPGA